jgi:hypothetical protein
VRHRTSVGILALLTVALAACGGARNGAAPTRARFTAQADAICRHELAKLRRAAAIERAPLAAFTSVRRLIREAIVIQEAATDRLEALREPNGDAAEIRSWLTSRTVTSTLRRDAAEAPLGAYPAAVKRLQHALERATALERRMSRAYGFRVCGTLG